MEGKTKKVAKPKLKKPFDVVYRTTSKGIGRTMIAHRVLATSKTAAMAKVKSEMAASKTFKRCLMAIEL